MSTDAPLAAAVTGPAVRGMRTFFTVWGGQLVSVVGTSLTAFGLQIWVYTETGSVTALAIASLFFALPSTLVAPFAGALVDRWDRRRVMLAADTAAGAATLVIAGLFIADSLAVWHVYALVGVGAIGNAFQNPAWLASIPLLVPKKQLGRANGLVQLNDGLSLVIAPALAGAILVTWGLGGVLVTDVATFLVAVGTLMMVRFPRPKGHGEMATGTLRGDAAAGWHYIKDRPGLFGLLWVYAAVNFSLSFVNVLIIPMVLAFASEAAVGAVFSTVGIGAVIGSVAVSAWGGPTRRVRGTMVSIAIAGVAIAFAGFADSIAVIAIGGFLMMAVVPVANTASQVLWQTKVPPSVQGRVFAIRRMIASAISPLAIILAGPLADGVFEPLMAEGGRLADSIGTIIGTGPGRGVALMFILSGILTALIAAIGYALPQIRNLETDLPDHVEDDEPAHHEQ
ncbi:MAG TPA: MFS transporter [Acidimicrobiia bacterium]|nr:MFS transporter [Acidimicrobiia bacterium]